jgi:hypothetical protein
LVAANATVMTGITHRSLAAIGTDAEGVRANRRMPEYSAVNSSHHAAALAIPGYCNLAQSTFAGTEGAMA